MQTKIKTALFTRKLPGGAFNVEDQSISTGDRYYVDDSGVDAAGYGYSPEKPCATIDYAISNRLTASQGDIIYVMPGHSEVVTAAITCDVIGFKIQGLGWGGLIPTIQANGAIDAITITAANVVIDNLQFTYPGASGDGQTSDINIAAAGCIVRNCKFIGSTTDLNKESFITITSAGNDFLIENCRAYNVTVEVTIGISIEGACTRGEIRNCFIEGNFTTAALADGAAATLLYIHDNVFKGIKADVAVVDFTNNSTGVCLRNFWDGRHTTIASNCVEGNAMDFCECYVVEQAALSGLMEPVADADS